MFEDLAIEGPRGRGRRLGWLAHVLVALLAATLVARFLPMWFRDDDGAFLGFAAHHPISDAFLSDRGAVQSFYRPVSVAFFALAYRVFGLTYWPYQFTQVLLTFGIWAAFYAMLRQLWGRPRPALAAAVLHPLIFPSLYYFNFRFSQVNYQLEPLLGFSAVALAAWGWRRRSALALVAALALTELSYGAKEPACVYLPILHVFAAVALGRRAGVRGRWIVLYLAAGVAMTAAHVALVRSHLANFGQAGAHWLTFREMRERTMFYADLLRHSVTGVSLTILSGLACAGQAMRIRRLRRWPVLTPVAAGAAGIEALRFLHPILSVLAASLLAAPALPFALAATVLLAVIAQLEPMWTIYLLQASWMIVAALVAAIAFSPLPAAVGRAYAWCRRGAIRSVAAAAVLGAVAVGAAVAGAVPAQRLGASLQETSWRRTIARDLTQYAVANLPRNATLSIAQWRDLGTTHEQQHELGYLERSRQLIQWYNGWYWNVLDVAGRGDIVATYVDDRGVTQAIDYTAAAALRDRAVYVMTTSRAETEAAETILAYPDRPAEPLATVRFGEEEGRLLRLPAVRPVAGSQ